MRRLSNNNQQSLLPLNMPHYSDETPGASNMLPSNAHRLSHMASMSKERNDTLVGFKRQEIYLQKTLQNLLDAQSEGLQSGLGMSPEEDGVSSAAGGTPTLDSIDGGSERAKGVVPARQSKNKRIGLRSARRGISRAMNDLAALKTQEEEVMEAQLADTEEDLIVVQGLTSKKRALEQQVSNIENEEVSRNIGKLQQEERTLDAEIKATENKLWEMKSRQRHLLGHIESLDNSIQSKLSSYKAALTLAEKEARAFLARPKVSSLITGSQSLWALPVPRRTLEMASEQFYEEREKIRQRSVDIEVEKNALEEGLLMWEDVVADVTAVEKTLREEMQQLSIHQSSRTAENSGTMDGTQTILRRMESAKSHIESQLTIAEERKWKLLVCCIGAELEAILEGYEILQNVVGTSQSPNMVDRTNVDRDRPNCESQSTDGMRADPPSTSKPQETLAKPPRVMDRSEDEDDEPGPELLISHMEDE